MCVGVDEDFCGFESFELVDDVADGYVHRGELAGGGFEPCQTGAVAFDHACGEVVVFRLF